MQNSNKWSIFFWGIVAGSLGGLILGSALTFWLGGPSANLLRRVFRSLFGQREGIDFKLLLQ